MNKYKILFSIKAKNDLKLIVSYIKNNLLEPNIAQKYAKLIQNEIKGLEYSPKKFPILDIKIKGYKEIRKLTVKKYIIFYIVEEENKTVIINRILGGSMNWQNEI